MLQSIPWESRPTYPPAAGQWLAQPEQNGSIRLIFFLLKSNPLEATVYQKRKSTFPNSADTEERNPHIYKYQVTERSRQIIPSKEVIDQKDNTVI